MIYYMCSVCICTKADAIDAGRQVESRGREASSVDLEEQLEHYEEIYQKIKVSLLLELSTL